MKNKSSKDERAKKKGFYYALYGSLCTAIALAAVISVSQLLPGDSAQTADNRGFDVSELEPTGTATVRSYLDQEMSANAAEIAERERNETQPPVRQAPQQTPAADDTTGVTAPPVAEPRQAEPQQTTPTETESESAAESPVETFEAFAEGSSMTWPLIGEIVMPFSMDALVYDRTLDQFRTNDSISIAAAPGTQVRAASDGVVTAVKNTRERGNVVVVDNGNGWTTTYSQLQDGVLVSEGDIVRRSQVIGGVGNPSIFSVLLGNHLEFSVARDDVAKNPLDILTD